jgi:hypothetical protein
MAHGTGTANMNGSNGFPLILSFPSCINAWRNTVESTTMLGIVIAVRIPNKTGKTILRNGARIAIGIFGLRWNKSRLLWIDQRMIGNAEQ